MTRARLLTGAARLLPAIAGFAILAFLIVPFSLGDKHIAVVNGRDLDATQGCLLTAAGIDRLLAAPRSFYDTSILYPDRNQLRSTEPFLGYAVLGLPLRLLFRLNDVDLFEVLRWAIVFASLVYGYLLFRVVGLDRPLAAAGAGMCLSVPALVNEIERLQVLCIPLLLPVLYHALALWKTSQMPAAARTLHAAALWFFTALYPLCGAINATVATLALIFTLPLAVAMLADLRSRKRLADVLIPIAAAIIVDAVVLAPWLLDRSDLRPYVTGEFLAIKHWNPTNLPLRLRHVAPFLAARVGWSLVAAAVALVAAMAQQRNRAQRGSAPTAGCDPRPSEQHLVALLVPALALLGAAAFGVTRQSAPWLGVLLDLLCAATVLLNWRNQLRPPPVEDEAFAGYIAAAAAGVAVLLCFVSFGPVYASNRHPLATNLTRVLFFMLPALKSIREYDRIWAFGMVFLSIYLTLRLGIALRHNGPVVRNTAAVVVAAPLLVALHERPLAASAPVEAPKALLAAAFHSHSRGPIYVHPEMKWNSRSGVLMVAVARDLGRPVVNGCLGICPPWFFSAASVLHRFPDPEALWLLRRWKVQTVVGVTGDVVDGGVDGIVKAYENNEGLVVWEIDEPAAEVVHPSAPATPDPGEQQARIEAEWSRSGERGDTGTVDVEVPPGFLTRAVEIQFADSMVRSIPDQIDVFAFDGDQRVRMNRGHAGEWIESLAADAFVHRRRLRAVVALSGPLRDRFQIECRHAAQPALEQIQLIGSPLEQPR
jgi:hypothetical protein